MVRKKRIVVLLALFLCLLLTGCGEEKMVQTTIEAYFDAMITGDYEMVKQFTELSREDWEVVIGKSGTFDYAYEFFSQNAQQLRYEIDAITVESNTAQAAVTVQYVDVYTLFSDMVKELIAKAYTTDTFDENFMVDTFELYQSKYEIRMAEKTIAVQCVKNLNGKWVVVPSEDIADIAQGGAISAVSDVYNGNGNQGAQLEEPDQAYGEPPDVAQEVEQFVAEYLSAVRRYDYPAIASAYGLNPPQADELNTFELFFKEAASKIEYAIQDVVVSGENAFVYADVTYLDARSVYETVYQEIRVAVDAWDSPQQFYLTADQQQGMLQRALNEYEETLIEKSIEIECERWDGRWIIVDTADTANLLTANMVSAQEELMGGGVSE